MNEVKFFLGLLLLVVATELVTRLTPAPVALGLYSLCMAITGMWLWRLGQTPTAQLFARALAFCVLSYAALLVAGAASGGDDPLRPLATFSGQANAATPTAFVPIRNSAQLDAEIARAQAQGKTVMLDFYADWCVSCKVMERHVLRRPDVAARLNRFVLLQADVTANNRDDRALLQRFSLLGPPSILFFNALGREISAARLIGEVNAQEFIAHLDQHGL
jgi:thiol:disulfide interchange protein DsbD